MVLEYLNKYKEELKRCINDLKHLNTVYKQIPNMLTFSRFVGVIPINILFFTGNVIPAIVLTGLILSTDLFDGRLARKWGVQSKFGADLDAVCDKFMFLGLSLPLMINNLIIIFNFILEGLISGVNVYGRIKGVDTRTVFMGKLKTCFLSLTLIVGYIGQFFSIPSAILTTLVSMTSFSQGLALNEYVRKYREMMILKEKDNNIVMKNKVDHEELVIKKEDSLIDELKREKELLLEVDKEVLPKTKKRIRIKK